jgi:nicotinamidase-related amidase
MMPAATLNSFAGTFTNPPSNPDEQRGGFGSDLGNSMGRCLMIGSWNAQLYDPLRSSCRAKQDIVCAKTRVSGLWSNETPFSDALRRHEIKTLLFAGVNTNQCVLGTLLDCYYRGLDCVMLEDCCATATPGGQDVCIKDISV